MRRSFVVGLVLASALSLSCASLVLRPKNSPPTKAAKVLTRALLVVPTFGLSEGAVAAAKRNEKAAEQRAEALEAEARYVQSLRDCMKESRALALSDSEGREVHLLAHDQCSTELRDHIQHKTDREIAVIEERARSKPTSCSGYAVGNAVFTSCR